MGVPHVGVGGEQRSDGGSDGHVFRDRRVAQGNVGRCVVGVRHRDGECLFEKAPGKIGCSEADAEAAGGLEVEDRARLQGVARHLEFSVVGRPEPCDQAVHVRVARSWVGCRQ